MCAVEKAATAKRPTAANSVMTMEFGVDSCAGVSVAPASMFQDYPLEETAQSKSGTVYYPAGVDSSIHDMGNRMLDSEIPGKKRKMRLHVCKVRKPVLAVSEMVDAGHDVHFSKNNSHAYRRKSREYTKIVARTAFS